MTREAYEPDSETAAYYAPFHLFMSQVRDPRFRNLASFALLCELSLMYDPVIAGYSQSNKRRSLILQMPPSPEVRAFWEGDYGPGVAFLSLITALNQSGEKIPSFEPMTDGAEMYNALAHLANIPVSGAALEKALDFIDSEEFLFNQPEWGIFFSRTREHLRLGLDLRRRWGPKPLLSCVLLHSRDDLLKTVSVPVLIRYENALTGPTTDADEVTLLLFSTLVAGVLATGTGECLLKRKYPWLCGRSKQCEQGSRNPITSSAPRIAYWCPYARGLLVLRNWLFGAASLKPPRYTR
jgi:hypothetical protein